MTSFRRSFGWMLVGGSLLLHMLTVLCFTRQPDRLAAFTVVPIWFWGGIGLLLSSLAFYFLRASLSLVVTGVWAITLLVGADEAQVLGNIGKPSPQPGTAVPHHGQPVMRVITLNCAQFKFGNPAADIAAWDPDIVLLQQALPHHVRLIADALYDGHGDYHSHHTNGVVTRWQISKRTTPLPAAHSRNQQVTVTLPTGGPLHVVNLHLATAATDLRLWKSEAWLEHWKNRTLRRQELAVALGILEQTTPFPHQPVIFGGDFNAPATDVVHDHLATNFQDAFTAAGTGWGNTFHRRLPILRIDHLYATRHLSPVRSRAATSRETDHRMVIADFLMPH